MAGDLAPRLRLEALGFEFGEGRGPVLAEPMDGLGPWRADLHGGVSLDLRESAPREPANEMRRAFDEGELDAVLLYGGRRPRPAATGRVEVKVEVEAAINALSGRFPNHIAGGICGAGRAQLQMASGDVAKALQRNAQALGLLVDVDEDALVLHLNQVTRPKTMNVAFDILRRALKFIEAEREPIVDAPSQMSRERSRVRSAGQGEVETLLPKLVALEAKIFEAERRDTPEKLRIAFDERDGVACVAEVLRNGEWALAGFSLAIPLEMVDADGPNEDVFRGADNTIYAVSTTLDPDLQGLGLGLRLKQEVLKEAETLRDPSGAPRYRFLTGRNRVGATDAMMRVNARLGGYAVASYEGQYGGEGEAVYYRMPVGAIARTPTRGAPPAGFPLAEVPQSWLKALSEGAYSGVLLRPRRLQDALLPQTLDALEFIAALVPSLPTIGVFGSLESALGGLREELPGETLCVLGALPAPPDMKRVSSVAEAGADILVADAVSTTSGVVLVQREPYGDAFWRSVDAARRSPPRAFVWVAAAGAVFVHGMRRGTLGDGDEFEVLRAWHFLRGSQPKPAQPSA